MHCIITDGNGTFILTVSASDYLESLKDQALLSVTALAMVEETRQSWVNILPYRLHRPDLTLVVGGKKGENCVVLKTCEMLSHRRSNYTCTMSATILLMQFLMMSLRS